MTNPQHGIVIHRNLGKQNAIFILEKLRAKFASYKGRLTIVDYGNDTYGIACGYLNRKDRKAIESVAERMITFAQATVQAELFA